MAKGKDFYGKEISEVIDQACKDLGASREELDIEVLETGSAGIFGLCKKKAHIRVQRKASAEKVIAVAVEPAEAVSVEPVAVQPPVTEMSVEKDTGVKELPSRGKEDVPLEKVDTDEDEQEAESEVFEEEAPLEPPSVENLAAIQADLHQLLVLMGMPSEVEVLFEQNTVQCNITGPYETQIIGPDGRTLDSLQYLLRKMVARHLPDKIMLALNAGDFRERRAEELMARAVELAELVKADGKTQAIPALNPSERRVVHMVLQEDKGVRSRSVGDGLFKKVLIYKPGKGRRPVSRKRRGGQGGRPSGD